MLTLWKLLNLTAGGGAEKNACRWVKAHEQGRESKNIPRVTWGGESKQNTPFRIRPLEEVGKKLKR